MNGEALEVFACPHCGIVRLLSPEPSPPWCRHGDPSIVAARMKPKGHDYLDRLGIHPEEHWLRVAA
jgi:hypothetical protein